MPNVRDQALTFEESVSRLNSFSAPLRLFSGFILLSQIKGRLRAVRAAGVFWIQTLAEISKQLKLLPPLAALRFPSCSCRITCA